MKVLAYEVSGIKTGLLDDLGARLYELAKIRKTSEFLGDKPKALALAEEIRRNGLQEIHDFLETHQLDIHIGEGGTRYLHGNDLPDEEAKKYITASLELIERLFKNYGPSGMNGAYKTIDIDL